jgi:alkylation response protein AidB-like acyl-CoA dehydrogenase
MATNVTVDALLDRVQDMAPILRAHSAEAQRYLSRPVVDAMLQAGLYSMARPKAFGDLELDPITMFRVLEEVARQDNAAEILHSHPPTLFAGSFTLGRQARPVDGGYRLRGQWPFASGSHDAHWFVFIPDIMDGDQPGTSTRSSSTPSCQPVAMSPLHACMRRGPMIAGLRAGR